MAGFVCFLVLAAVVWVGGCSLQRHIGKQREAVYAEIWETAPELERAHRNLSVELERLNDFKSELRKRKRMFTTEEGKRSADAKIETVSRQIARLESQAETIMAAVEQQSLTNLSSKVENPMQREKIRSLEEKAEEAVRDAVGLREAIEKGVGGDSVSSPAPESPPAPGPAPKPEPVKKQKSIPPRSIPKAVVVEEVRPAMRTWRDRKGHSVSARLIAVIDSRERVVKGVGESPERLLRSGYLVQLQRVDGKIIKGPIEKFSSRDISFLSR